MLWRENLSEWRRRQFWVPVSLVALLPDEPVHIYPLAVFSRWPAVPFFIDPISHVSVVALQASYLSDRAACLPPACLPGLGVCTLLTQVHMGVYYLKLAGKTSECKISLVTYSVSCLSKRPAAQMGWGCSLCSAPFEHTQLKQAPGALRDLWA